MARRNKAITEARAVRLPSAAKPSQAEPDVPPPDLGPLKPTAVYNTYWRFAAERQAVFFRRPERRPPPWTHDPVLRAHKFTNAYRGIVGVRSLMPKRDLTPTIPDYSLRIEKTLCKVPRPVVA